MHKPSPALVISSLALVFSMTGGAFAASTALQSNSVGSAQIRPRSVHLSDLAKNARPGSITKARTASLVESVITDPQYGIDITVHGDKGDKGDAVVGPAGPSGAPGPATLPTVNVYKHAVSVAPGTTGLDTVSCLAGETLTGGGVRMEGDSLVHTSTPEGNNWVARVTNRNQIAADMVTTALCTVTG